MGIHLTDNVKEHILSMSKRRDGRITPDEVVNDARDRTSPLHGCFDWNDTTAAHKHRLHTARQIISSVRVTVTVEREEVKVVGYVRDPDLYGTRNSGYREIERIAEDVDDSAKLFASEIERCEGIIRRAIDIARTLGLEADARKAIRQLTNIRRRAQDKDAA